MTRGLTEALAELRGGRIVVVADDDGADLVMGAELASAPAVNFMASNARGLVCLALPEQRCAQLGLDAVPGNGDGARFGPSIDARHGLTGGLSAHDRATTIRVAAGPNATERDLVRPGHVLPLATCRGGVLQRPARVEAAVDLARLAGLSPAAVLCGVLNEDGTLARGGDLTAYLAQHGLELLTVRDVIAHRCRTEQVVERAVETRLPTRFGELSAVGYHSLVDDRHHIALTRGTIERRSGVLAAVHAECLAGDVLRSVRCDCREHLDTVLEQIAREGGVVIYLSRHARGIELLNGPPAEPPDYATVAQILADLGPRSIRLVAGDDAKVAGLSAHGVTVVERLRPAAPEAPAAAPGGGLVSHDADTHSRSAM